jgi:hypothetical protein
LLKEITAAHKRQKIVRILVNKYTVGFVATTSLVGGGYHCPDWRLEWCEEAWRQLANKLFHTIYMSVLCVFLGWGMEEAASVASEASGKATIRRRKGFRSE